MSQHDANVVGTERETSVHLPHWPYNAAPVDEAAVLVVLVAVVVAVVVVPVLLPKLNEMLYALTLNTASVPVNGSVPAPILVTYWLVL